MFAIALASRCHKSCWASVSSPENGLESSRVRSAAGDAPCARSLRLSMISPRSLICHLRRGRRSRRGCLYTSCVLVLLFLITAAREISHCNGRHKLPLKS